jgi:hypothetical protein
MNTDRATRHLQRARDLLTFGEEALGFGADKGKRKVGQLKKTDSSKDAAGQRKSEEVAFLALQTKDTIVFTRGNGADVSAMTANQMQEMVREWARGGNTRPTKPKPPKPTDDAVWMPIPGRWWIPGSDVPRC